ncbi:MAG: SCP2 sterol-binding domain-containing protein [Methylococcaceae bacterium]
MSGPNGVGSGMLKAALAGGLDAVLHHAPANPALLISLAGRIIELQLKPFGSSVRLAVHTDGIQLTDDISTPADVCLSGTLGAWAAFGLRRDYRMDPLSVGLMLSGDPALVAATLSLISPAIDAPPPKTHSRNDTRQHWIGYVTANLKQNLAEYWQEESRELPASAEVEALYRDIDETRVAAEQLEVRVHTLFRQLTPDATPPEPHTL